MPPQANTSQDPFGQIADKLKSATNVLVTVSSNPSVDQLAACIGLTVALNKLGKHATAVFSGGVPSTIEFLEPEKTLESNTDSLRDFIIALDKSKADKLRYKVEEDVVKIFITPYKTSIGEKDLEFSQGDFNVDAVVALGVHRRSELDQAITSHGRILHDAAMMSINTSNQNELGSIDWTDSGASSLCEMVSDVISELGKDTFDAQISTALLTGIVAETDRFSNEKASPHTMSVSGTLMAAGASTQLVASKLEAAETSPHSIPQKEPQRDEAPESEPNPDGMIQIDHPEEPEPEPEIPPVQDLPDPIPEPEVKNEIKIDDREALPALDENPEEKDQLAHEPPGMVMEPPKFGGQLTANSVNTDEQYAQSTDSLSVKPMDGPMLSRSSPAADISPKPDTSSAYIQTPIYSDSSKDSNNPPPTNPPTHDTQTLSDIERAVDSPHLKYEPETPSTETLPAPVDDIRQEVKQAEEEIPYKPEPIAALNAQDFGLDLGHSQPVSETETTKPEDQGASSTSASPPASSSNDEDTLENILNNNSPPPPVPPPMMPPTT